MSFKEQAENFLASLADALMTIDALEIDEMSDGLSIIGPTGHYLLNYHGVAHQLWLSSPVSGAHHFNYQDPDWICTRTDQPLLDVLDRELAAFGCSLRGLKCS